MKQYWYVMLLLLLIAGGLRFTDLEKESIWLDEGYALRNAQQPTWGDFVHIVQYKDGTPPLYYAFLHYWIAGVGLDAWWLRLPSVLLSIFAVFLIFYLGKELHSPKLGLIAATLMTFSLSHIVYAQEARPYGFFTVFILCSTISFLWMIQKKSAIPYIISTVLMLYTHNLAIFVVALHGIAYLFVYKEDFPLTSYLKNLAWVGFLYLPNLIVFAPHQFVHTDGFVRQAMIGKMGAPAAIANIGAFLFVIIFAIGCSILYFLYRLYKKGCFDETIIEKQHLLIFLLSAITMIGLFFIVPTIITSTFITRYSHWGFVFLYLALAYCFLKLKPYQQKVLAMIYIALVIFSLFTFYTADRKEEIDAVAAVLTKNNAENIILIDGDIQYALAVYYKNMENIRALPSEGGDEIHKKHIADMLKENKKDLWIVYSHAYLVENIYKQSMEQHYPQKETFSFIGAEVVHYAS